MQVERMTLTGKVRRPKTFYHCATHHDIELATKNCKTLKKYK